MTQSHSPDLRHAIAERAYFISQAQGFVPGRDFDNWVIAEAQVTNELHCMPANGRAKKNGSAAQRGNGKAAAPKTVKIDGSGFDTEVPADFQAVKKRGNSRANPRD